MIENLWETTKRSRIMRRAGSLMLATLVISALASPARADHTATLDRSDIPVLAGKTTVFGDETAWTRVRLPESVPFLELGELSLSTRVRGDGRLLGIFLFQEKNGEIDDRGSNWWIWRSGNCGTRGCERNSGELPGMTWDLDERDMIPAGVYRLYLVVDGAPGSVYFEIEGLSGATRIHPTRPMGEARAKVQTLKTRLHTPAAGVAGAFGNERPFGGRGMAIQELWVDPVGPAAVESVVCWYRREAPADPATAYAPPDCGLIHTAFVQWYTPPWDVCCPGWTMSLNYLPKAMGGWYVSSTPVESAGSVALWLKV